MKGAAGRCGRRGQGRGGDGGVGETGRRPARGGASRRISSAGGARRASAMGQASTCSRGCVGDPVVELRGAAQVEAVQPRDDGAAASAPAGARGSRRRRPAGSATRPAARRSGRARRRPPAGRATCPPRPRRRRQAAAPPGARRAVGARGGLLRVQPLRAAGERSAASRSATSVRPQRARQRATARGCSSMPKRCCATVAHGVGRPQRGGSPAASGGPYSASSASSASWAGVSARPVPCGRPRAPTSTACQPPSVNALNAPMMVGTLRPGLLAHPRQAVAVHAQLHRATALGVQLRQVGGEGGHELESRH